MGWMKYIYSGYVILFIFLFQPTSADENEYVENGRQVVQDFYRRYNSREVDLVFVLDRSASVPRAGWESMLDFVRSLLEHFTLSHDSTRIAIISFSTHVSTDVNDLQEGRENKCSMMRQIHHRLGQKVMSGYTSTNEALKKAKRILLRSRHGAKKGIFVLTDGKSNIGAAPVQASIELRSLQWDMEWNVTDLGPQLEIYAFGIKDAYMPELRSVASPLPNHTYFIPDFRTFEELARSIHNGEQTETWDVVSNMRLCESRCDEHALCTCATKSGQYVCVCKAGYYGNGYSCSECPRGTFKNTLTPHLCVPCPSNSTTMLPGATNDGNCICQPPYHQDEERKSCELRSCPDLPEIDNAHKFGVIGRIKDEVRDTGDACMNSPETSCHYKCIVGYRLDNHPGLVCNMNGTWSGQVPRCQVVDCGTLAYHSELDDKSQVTYTNGTTSYQSMVTVSCQTGWRLFGNHTRSCTQQGIWSGTPAYCIEAKCPAIRSPEGGRVTPPECAATRQMPGRRCSVTCESGFQQQGPGERTCSTHGTWDVSRDTACVDVEAPVIKCPEDISTPVTSSNYAVVHWDSVPPRYSDNSGSGLQIQTIGVQTSPAQLGVGYHQVRYIVRDSAGNMADCTQGIHVLEKVVRMEYCPEDIVITGVQGSIQEVTWRSPIFLDNNNNTIPYVCSRPSGSTFSIGTRNILCSLQETVPDLPSCVFSVTLERVQCYHPPEPLHGSVTCAETADLMTVCSVSCNTNYDFYRPPQLTYTCFNGQWRLREPDTWWPDCSRTRLPRRAYMRSHARYFYHGGACESMKARIAQTFEAWVQKRAFELCAADSCPLENIQVKCGEDSRRRRNAEHLHQRRPEINGHIKHKAILQYEKYVEPRYKRSLDDVSQSSPTVAAGYFPVVEGKGSHGDSVQIHPTVSVRSHNEEETYRGDELIVEESPRGINLQPPSIDVQLSTPQIPLPATHMTTEHFVSPNPSESTERTIASNIEEDSGSVANNPLNSKEFINLQRPGEFSQVSTETNTIEDSTDSVTEISEIQSTISLNSESPEVSTEDGDSSEPTADSTEASEPESSSTATETSDVPILSSASPTASPEDSHGDEGNQTVEIQFTLSRSSNASDMSYEEQFLVMDELFALADGLQAQLTNSSIAVDEDNSSSLLVPSSFDYADPEFEECGPGLVAAPPKYYSKVCVLCPVGTYHINSTCVMCPIGQFQEVEGQLECQPCQENTTTAEEGATNSSQCREPCPPGSYSDNGLAPCSLCPVGSYQNQSQSSACSECMEGHSTASQGSTSLYECQQYCPPGSYGRGGIQPCELCPLISYQPQGGSSECMLCPEYKMAASQGAVARNECLEYDPCSDNSTSRCENGGECTSSLQNMTECICPLGWTGQWCEVNVQECSSNPCLNGGTCMDGIANFTCQCTSGYTGTVCELDLDACLSSPCENGGSCDDLKGEEGYDCYCVGSYTGHHCEVADDCSYLACDHGELYLEGGTVCRCDCDPGFLGVSCDLVLDLCLTFPCHNSRRCHTFPNDFTCDCLPGYTGKTCTEEIDECEREPCHNGGICFDRVNGFYCKCPAGYTGTHCQQEVSSNFDLVFNYASSANFAALEGEVIPVMTAVTVCFWTRTNQMFGSGTIFSYAVPAHEDQGTMATEFELKNVGELKLLMKGDTASTGVCLESVWWHHVCLAWQADGGSWEVYINGTRVANGVGLSEGGEIIGGGTLIIGQEQSSEGNLFNIWQSFVGEITQFNVYDELLPLSVIEALANQDQCEMTRHGTVVPWTLVLNGVYGDLEVRNHSKCLDVNECMITGSFPCTANHICKDTIGGYYCSGCQYGFHGNSCLEPIDECSYNVCENRACEDGPEPFDFVCSCQPGYTGHLCENIINYCDSSPCPADRECLPRLGSFNCVCMNSSCDDLGTACSPNPCQNNAVCSPDGNSFICVCPEGFDGTHCEVRTRQCRNSPCQNRGVCEFEIATGRPVCYCDLQWRGQWCEVMVRSDCSLSPCLNGGTCEDIQSEVGYLCHCDEVPGVSLDANCGYADPCESAPCEGRGMCVRLPNNTFMCDCVSGYTGPRCQHSGDSGLNSTHQPPTHTSPATVECGPSTCENGGSCSPTRGCVCPIEFTGSQCQVQKHTVSSYYKGTVTLLIPYTAHNQQMVETQFDTQLEQVFADLKSSGLIAAKLLSLKGSVADTEMQAEFELTHTEYVLSLEERTGYDEVRQILRSAVSSGHLGSLPTRMGGFTFKQVAQPERLTPDKPREERLTMYLLIGLVGSMLLLVAVSVLVFCKIRAHRKRQHTLRLLPNMNNAGNINLTMLTNPVFENTEEDNRRQHGSLTEENPYAEFGEAIVPYEVTYASKSNVKDCNLVRDAARKNSESSFTSVRSSINRKDKDENPDKALVCKDYITPVVSKNELGQIEDVSKDDKKLLPNSTKYVQKPQQDLDCDEEGYLEPVKLKREYVAGEGEGSEKLKGEGQENMKGEGQENVQGKGQAPIRTTGYVNVIQEQKYDSKSNEEQNLPYIDMQTSVGQNEKNEFKFVNEETEKESKPAPKASPIDRLAYMINKPMRSDEDAYYVEAANQIPPPEYLDAQAPTTPEATAPDMSKRKLPPLPVQSARF